MKDPQKDIRPVKITTEDWIDGNFSDPAVALDESDHFVIARQLVMHSLLTGHFESVESRENRIQRVLQAFDERSTLQPQSPAPAVRRSWMFIATTTATLVAVLCVWGFLTPHGADAALSRVIAATRLPVTRVYNTKIQRRILGRDVYRKATLYSRSIDRFAAEFHETTLRPPLWIGFDGQQRWLVAGESHWSSDDEVDLPRDAIIDRITLKNLQFNALLTEIPKSFHVRLLPRETISIDGQSFDCQPLEATPDNPDGSFPDVILIWPHPQSGVVLQMHVIKIDRGPRGVSRVEFQFAGQQEVPDNFFSLDGHKF